MIESLEIVDLFAGVLFLERNLLFVIVFSKCVQLSLVSRKRGLTAVETVLVVVAIILLDVHNIVLNFLTLSCVVSGVLAMKHAMIGSVCVGLLSLLLVLLAQRLFSIRVLCLDSVLGSSLANCSTRLKAS